MILLPAYVSKPKPKTVNTSRLNNGRTIGSYTAYLLGRHLGYSQIKSCLALIPCFLCKSLSPKFFRGWVFLTTLIFVLLDLNHCFPQTLKFIICLNLSFVKDLVVGPYETKAFYKLFASWELLKLDVNTVSFSPLKNEPKQISIYPQVKHITNTYLDTFSFLQTGGFG